MYFRFRDDCYGKWYDGIVDTAHSKIAIKRLAQKLKKQSLSYSIFDDILSDEIEYIKNSPVYSKLVGSPFFRAFKKEFDEFLKDGVLPPDCLFVDGYGPSRHEYSQIPSYLSAVLSAPFKPQWRRGEYCSIESGLMVRVYYYHGSDGDASELIDVALPCGYRNLDREERQCFAVLVADTYPDLFRCHITFFSTQGTKTQLIRRNQPVQLLDYECGLTWDPKSDAESEKPAPPKGNKKDLF